MSVLQRAAPSGDPDERELIERARDGDRQAFGTLYARHRGRVHRVLHRLLHDYPADVDDVASAVFMTALERISTFDGSRGSFETWLNLIVKYAALSHRTWRAGRREDELAEPAVTNGVMARRGLGTEELAILRLELVRMMSSLSARRRLVLLLSYWAGWSFPDIARAIGTSPGAAQAMAGRARLYLQRSEATGAPAIDRTVCACGCGIPLADDSPGNQRYATERCAVQAQLRTRAARRARREHTDPGADPLVDRVVITVQAAGPGGLTRSELVKSLSTDTCSGTRVWQITSYLVGRGLVWTAQERTLSGQLLTRCYAASERTPENAPPGAPAPLSVVQVQALLEAAGPAGMATGAIMDALAGRVSKAQVSNALRRLREAGTAVQSSWGHWCHAGQSREVAA